MKKFTYLLLIIFAPVLTRAQVPDATTLTKVGGACPSFSFETDKGKTVNIADYRGKIVLINFFATWCPPCREELPRVQKDIWEKYKDNAKFALFVFGREEGWDKVLTFKQTNNYTFLMLPDEGRKIFSLFATQYIPRTLLLDEKGNILFQSVGYDPKEFDGLLNLLKDRLNKTL
ncbi:TlpA family protein disulfide reductase [Mucilaginibacter sp. AW1-3]